MFVVEMQKREGITLGKWFPILHTESGAEAAEYLKQLEEEQRSDRNHRIMYKVYPAARKEVVS